MFKANNILLVGGGGHCTSVLDTLLKTNKYNKIAIIDKDMPIRDTLMGISCLGNDDILEELFASEYKNAFISVGSIGNPKNRKRIYNNLKQIGFNIPNIIDLTAIIGSEVTLGEGIYIGKNAVINTCSGIGTGAIINTSSTIEHECIIGEFTHISPGAVLCGNVTIGSESHIGANATIRQNTTIGDNVMIGMGSVVLKNIQNNRTAYGNPAVEVIHE